MKTRGWRIIVLSILGTGALYGGTGTWENFTSMKDVKGVARSGQSYWAATSGGLFRWDEGTDSYLKLTNAEGLLSTDLTAVGIDRNGDVWGCASTGMIHIYTPSTGFVRTISNIVEFPGPTDKKINAVITAGDTVLLCSDFGLSVYRLGRGEFGDTFTSFGGIPANNRVAVYRCRDQRRTDLGGCLGRYHGQLRRLGEPYQPEPPRPPAVDPPAGRPPGLNTAGTRRCSTAASMRGRQRDSITMTGPPGRRSPLWRGFDRRPERLLLSLGLCTAKNLVYTVDSVNTPHAYGPPLPFTPTSLVTGSNGLPSAGTLSGGIQIYGGSWVSHYPNGPNSNQFNDVTVTPNGTLWGAGGASTAPGPGSDFTGTTDTDGNRSHRQTACFPMTKSISFPPGATDPSGQAHTDTAASRSPRDPIPSTPPTSSGATWGW
jgi:hypothetical protein